MTPPPEERTTWRDRLLALRRAGVWLLRVVVELRLPIAGVVVALAVGSVAWRAFDGRLAGEARRQAAEGRVLGVTALRDDWVVTVLPVALNADEPAGGRARRVANLRLDQAIRDRATLAQTALDVLAALRQFDRPPTPEAVDWAEWVVTRLTDAAGVLPPDERFRVLMATDATLTTLAARARREPPEPLPPPTPTASEPDETAVADNQPAEEEPAPTPLSPPPPASAGPSTLAVNEPPPPTPKPQPVREPLAWRPGGSEAAAQPLPPEPAGEDAFRPIAQQTDRDLLAEFVAISRELPQLDDRPRARGPTAAPTGDDPHAEKRRRQAAIGAELVRRGFRGVSDTHVDALVSADPADRLGLVERLLTERSGDAARLMLVLASDASAEVRAAAIGALGSSTSRPLVQKAFELATEDPDPRVGRLAETLRERLR